MTERKAKVVIEGEDRFSRTFAAFDRTVKGSERVIGGLESRIGALGLTLGSLGAGLSVGAILAGVKNVADGFDRLNDAADATGEKIEVLSALEDLARRNGGSLEQVEDALIKINKALGDTDPDSETARALAAIGLSAAELRRQSPGDALKAVATALAEVANDGEKSRITMALFGKSIREAAPFLNDLAEAGELNNSVTEEQAKAAEKFNKNLFELQTNVSNAARGLVGQLIPAINSYIATVKRAASEGAPTFITELLAELSGARYAIAVSKVEDLQEALTKDPGNAAIAQALRAARSEADALGRAAQGANDKLRALVGQDAAPEAGAGRGFVNPELVKPSARIADPAKKKSTAPSEAERYLEQLDRQLEKTYDLSAAEQALLDIQNGRISGLTPALQAEILARARLIDLNKQELDARTAEVDVRSRAARAALDGLDALNKQNLELEGEVRRIGLTEAAITDLELARINDAIATKQQTIAKQEAAGVDERQLQVLNAEIDALRRRKELLVEKVDKNAQEEARKAVDEVASGARSTLADSIEQGLLDGFRRGESLADVFLRELKAQFAKTVLSPVIQPIAQAGNQLIGSIMDSVLGYLGLGGGGFKAFDPNGTPITSGGGLGGYGLGGGRANGGPVRAGVPYWVGENGPEPFIPDSNGTILSNSQAQRGLGGQPMQVTINAPVTVNGNATSETVGLIKAAIASNNQMLLRSMRTGGAFSGG